MPSKGFWVGVPKARRTVVANSLAERRRFGTDPNRDGGTRTAGRDVRAGLGPATMNRRGARALLRVLATRE